MSNTLVKDMDSESTLGNTDLVYVSTDEGGGTFLDAKMSATDLRANVSPQLGNVVWVTTAGSDSTGDGTSEKSYASIKYALSQITDNDTTHRYTILVGPGVFTEDNPITCKSYVDIRGIGGAYTVKVVAQNVNSNILNLAVLASVDDITFSGCTGATALYMAGAVGAANINRCTIQDCQTGVGLNSITGGITSHDLTFFTTPVVGSITTGVHVQAGTISLFNTEGVNTPSITTVFKIEGANSSGNIDGAYLIATGTNGLYCDNGCTFGCSSMTISGFTNSIRIGSTGATDLTIYNSKTANSGTYDLLIESATAIFDGCSIEVTRDKTSIASGADVHTFGHDHSLDALSVLQDLKVGQDGIGNKSAFGEGGSYNFNTKVITYNPTGAVYADETDSANINFPSTLQNAAIYFGDIDSFQFHGLGYIMGNTDLLGGTLVWEYYDGGPNDWLEFDIMHTISDYSDRVDQFTGIDGTKYTFRLDCSLTAGVTESDASATGWVPNIIDGDSGYWVRCRVATAITTSMNFSTVRFKGNYTEIRDNGTISHHGDARTSKDNQILLFEVEGTAADTKNLNISTNILLVKIKKSLFKNGDLDKIYFRTAILDGMDVSCGLDWTAKVFTDVAPSGADQTAKLHLTYAKIKNGDAYVNTNPDSTQLITVTIPDGNTSNEIQTVVATDRLDISDLEAGDEVWGMVYREANEAGDDLAGDLSISNEWITYSKWQTGSTYA